MDTTGVMPDTAMGVTVHEQRAAQPLPMAAVMAGMPSVWRRLLAAHRPDRLGRCTACRTASGSGERWPCTLHEVASAAERIYELELGRAVGAESETEPGSW